MLSVEAETQQAPGNAQVIPNQNNPGQGTIYTECCTFYHCCLYDCFLLHQVLRLCALLH
jgi:hypothetical protein